MKRAVDEQTVPTLKAKRATELTRAERLLALHETHGLSDEALNAWCRERGFFAHDLTQWHNEFCDAAGASGRREDSEELRQLRLTNGQLQRDLNRKEKALAEAAALLVLQKNIGRCGRQRTYEHTGGATHRRRLDRRGGCGRRSAGWSLCVAGVQ